MYSAKFNLAKVIPAETREYAGRIIDIVLTAPCQIGFYLSCITFRFIMQQRGKSLNHPWHNDISRFDDFVEIRVRKAINIKIAEIRWYAKHDRATTVVRIVFQKIEQSVNANFPDIIWAVGKAKPPDRHQRFAPVIKIGLFVST